MPSRVLPSCLCQPPADHEHVAGDDGAGEEDQVAVDDGDGAFDRPSDAQRAPVQGHGTLQLAPRREGDVAAEAGGGGIVPGMDQLLGDGGGKRPDAGAVGKGRVGIDDDHAVLGVGDMREQHQRGDGNHPARGGLMPTPIEKNARLRDRCSDHSGTHASIDDPLPSPRPPAFAGAGSPGSRFRRHRSHLTPCPPLHHVERGNGAQSSVFSPNLFILRYKFARSVCSIRAASATTPFASFSAAWISARS